jgi:PmbA protein
MSRPLLEFSRQAVALARACGAAEAAAGAYRVRHVEVVWRDGRIEKVTEATTQGLGLDLYVDGRYASVSTSDLRAEALERFIADSVALTRTLAPDPYRQLPDPQLYRGQEAVALELEDPAAERLDMSQRRQTAERIESAARGEASHREASAILSVTATYGDSSGERALVHSNGFEGTRRSTDFGMSAEVCVRDPDGRRPEDWDGASARNLVDLPSPEAIGQSAARRALSRIGATKGPSARMTVAVEARAAGRLAGYLLGALSAAALQQKRSFLEGKLGEAIGAPGLEVRDDPLIPRGLGSRLYDSEGMASHRFPVFEAGRLRSYYVDTYYGRKLGTPPTTGRCSNLSWKLGQRSRAALLSDLGEGLLVTGFLGGNSNGTTGDFSLGVQGFRVRAGAVAEPVAEMNLSGNHLELWRQLAALGDDPYLWSPLRTPTLVFEGMQVAGT